MPITTGWFDDQKQIILVVYDGPYSWNDVYLSANTSSKLASEVDYPVANIIDMTRAGAVPPNAASHGKRLREMRHKNIQFEVVVGATAFMKTLANIANTVFKVFSKDAPSRFVDTMEEALRLIETEFLQTESQKPDALRL